MASTLVLRGVSQIRFSKHHLWCTFQSTSRWNPRPNFTDILLKFHPSFHHIASSFTPIHQASSTSKNPFVRRYIMKSYLPTRRLIENVFFWSDFFVLMAPFLLNHVLSLVGLFPFDHVFVFLVFCIELEPTWPAWPLDQPVEDLNRKR